MAVDEPAVAEVAPPARRRGISLLRLMGLVAIAAGCFAFLNEAVAVGLVIGCVAVAIWPLSTRWQTAEVVATVMWLLVAVVVYSDASVNGLAYIALGLVGLVLAVSWVFRAALALAARPIRRRPGKSSWPDRLAWAFVPAAGLLGLGLRLTDRDLELRLALSEPALRACVREAQAGRPAGRFPRRVGLFWVHRVEDREGVVLLSTGGFFLDEDGLAFDPAPLPPTWPEFKFWHVRGPWWRYHWDG